MNRWFPFLTLVLLSAFSLALFAARFLYSGQITYIFLLWNLFLAWMPLVFAWLAVTWRKWPPLALLAAFLWLLFFPNAPYLVTDLIHLRPIDPVPLWYDLIMLLDFALLGLFLAFVSLSMMQDLVSSRFGAFSGWSFTIAVLGISGLGIYIGRFLRWNSWDLFTRPSLLLNDIWASLDEPRTLIISGLLALLLLFAYLIFSTPLRPAKNFSG
jgi:uncharacterized membrane protein